MAVMLIVLLVGIVIRWLNIATARSELMPLRSELEKWITELRG